MYVALWFDVCFDVCCIVEGTHTMPLSTRCCGGKRVRRSGCGEPFVGGTHTIPLSTCSAAVTECAGPNWGQPVVGDTPAIPLSTCSATVTECAGQGWSQPAVDGTRTIPISISAGMANWRVRVVSCPPVEASAAGIPFSLYKNKETFKTLLKEFLDLTRHDYPYRFPTWHCL